MKWGDLLAHYQQVLDQEELPVYLGLWNSDETERHDAVRARPTQKERVGEGRGLKERHADEEGGGLITS